MDTESVEIQVLHIADCPNWQEAGARTRQALDLVGLAEVPVDFTLIASSEEAVRLGFAGSPTILLDGQDLFPARGLSADLACRIYPTDAGIAGVPTVGQLGQALRDRLPS